MLQPKRFPIPHRPGSVPLRGSRIPLRDPPSSPIEDPHQILGPREVSPFTQRLLTVLMRAELSHTNRARAAEAMFVSETTLARRLREDGLSYGRVLDRVRFHRCRALLARGWCGGPELAQELGFREVNSFYRAFRTWTGHGYRTVTGPQRCSGDPITLDTPPFKELSHGTI